VHYEFMYVCMYTQHRVCLQPLETDPPCDPASLIRASLSGDNNVSDDLDRYDNRINK